MQAFLDYINVLGKGSGRENAIIAALSIIAGLLGAISISLINKSVDNGFTFSFSLMLAFIVTASLSVLAKRFATRKMRSYLEEHIAKLRLDLTSSIRNADFSFVEQLEQGEAVAKMTIDARRISRTGDMIIKAYYGFCILFFTMIYMGWLSPLALILLVGLFVMSVLSVRFHNKHIVQTIEKTASEEEVLFQQIEHLTGGFKELKLDRAMRNDFFENKLLPLVERIRGSRKKTLYRFLESQLILEAMWLSFIGFFFIFNDSAALGAQLLLIFLFMEYSVADIIISLPFFTEANVASRRIQDLQDKVDGSVSVRPSRARDDQPTFETFKIRDLCFDYTDEQGQPIYSFGPVSFDIAHHEITFIIGGNGSGKTTFLKLLLGLYPPLSGYFAADDKKVRMHEQGHWFSAIFADFYLFNGLYGVDAVDERKLASLMDEMALSSKTVWQGERFTNTNLSTGQKKRLALVIALMEDKPIYVFDEWAAEQDAEFRTEFYERILPELKARGKTVIVVSHDDRYFHCADHVVKLDYGNLSEDRH
uniref:Putative ATP-binding cassette transporter n=1 Tax=Candidatus Kentrum sp. LPFa TaxID=2126335 RepID=A0A450WNT5_9GAMM|nr:MAG: putative ATP-binding cassette transporter [Candidatus Kentron sp. LPFa]